MMWFLFSKLVFLVYLLISGIQEWLASAHQESRRREQLELYKRGLTGLNETENGAQLPELGLDFTEEKVSVLLLRERIQDIIAKHRKFDDDLYLLQWLKIQELSPTEAEKMIRDIYFIVDGHVCYFKSIAWREKFGVENDSATYPPEFDKQFDVLLTTDTITGRPVVFVDCAGWNFGDAIAKHGMDALLLYWAKLGVKAENEMIAFNKRMNEGNSELHSNSTTGVLGIISMYGFDTTRVTFDANARAASLQILKNTMSYFPGAFSHCIFVNTGFTFSLFYAILKPFMSLPVEVYGTDRADWLPKIVQVKEENKIPPFLLPDHSKTDCWFC